MNTESHINTTVASLFESIEFTKEPAGLYDPLRYMIEIGGKRLRPRLCLTAYSLFKDEFDEGILSPERMAVSSFHFVQTVGIPLLSGEWSMMSSCMSVKEWNTSRAVAGERMPSSNSSLKREYAVRQRRGRNLLPPISIMYLRGS